MDADFFLVAPSEGILNNLNQFNKIRFERIKELLQLYYNELCDLLETPKPELTYHEKLIYGLDSTS